jgi:signal transduction histidine kinase
VGIRAGRRRSITMRARLAALYGGVVLVSGAILLFVLYLLLGRSIAQQPIVVPLVGAAPRSAEPSPAEAAALKPRLADAEAAIRAGLRGQTLPVLANRGLLVLAGLTVAGLGIGWYAAGRTLRPIQQITATTRRVADRSLHERIELAGPQDELRELADAVDGMLARLDAAFDGQRRFVGNASHELQTPLAINRTLLEVAMNRPDAPPELRQLGDVLLEVNARQERLIDGLLMLARSEHAVGTPVQVDLADVAGAAVAAAQPEIDRLGLAVTLVADPAPVRGDPVLLERLAQNLVQNAVRYNMPDGWLQVCTGTAAGSCRLTVANTGPLVPAGSLPALFEPFRRATDRVGSSSGTGLGLSIVRSVARVHHGEVDATSREGGGLIVDVRLPAGN